MREIKTLGAWLRRFLLEYIVTERNLSRNTQSSYRDAFKLLLPFLSAKCRKSTDRLTIQDLTATRVREFLRHLETDRGCSPQTRNQRLSAIRCLARFVAREDPAHVAWSGQLRALQPKKSVQPSISWLTKEEMEAMLEVTDGNTFLGCNEHAFLLFLFNTGARVSEAVNLTIGDLQLGSRNGHHPLVTLHGKGRKMRQVPLWEETVCVLEPLVYGRADSDPVFRNRCRQPFTRSGAYRIVERTAAKTPALAGRQVTPHVLRHTTACMLLRAGVDLHTIASWLGHASLETTNMYAHIDVEMKREALALCDPLEPNQGPPPNADKGVMDFLDEL